LTVSRRTAYFVSLLTALTILASPRIAAAGVQPWIEIRSPHFRVLTNGSVDEGGRVALDFEKLRYVFATQFPHYRLESGAPLLIFAPRDLASAEIVAPALASAKDANQMAGFFTHGWEKQYALIRLDTMNTMGEAPVFHEYTHSILHMNVHWLPTWLDEGIAEYYAYTRFEGDQILLGVSTARYPIISTGRPIPIETLLDVDESSPYYHDPDKVQMFYGESWALVHFLTLTKGMGRGEKINEFFRLLQSGADQKTAFVQVFGDFAKMNRALDNYMRGQFIYGVIPAPSDINRGTFTIRTLSVAETEAELAGFQLWRHEGATAGPLVAEALRDDPKLGFAHEEAGFLFFQDGRTGDAVTEFSKAYALDPGLYLSLFAKTMLSPIAKSDAADDEKAFRAAVAAVLQLNPQFAPAYVQLARLDVKEGDLNEALQFSQKAEALEPWRAEYRLETGQILLRMGRGPEAAAIARYVAQRWSSTDHNEAVELWNQVPADQRPAGDALLDAQPKDSQKVTGFIESENCRAQTQGVDFFLDHGGQRLTFHLKPGFEGGFSDTLWYGEDHFSFCHNLEGLRAVVYYLPPSDATYTGDAAEIDIRNDLPTPTPPRGTSPAPAPASTPVAAPSATPAPDH
jgi:tetratricopeptide (TPR) repeat protein